MCLSFFIIQIDFNITFKLVCSIHFVGSFSAPSDVHVILCQLCMLRNNYMITMSIFMITLSCPLSLFCIISSLHVVLCIVCP